MPNRIIKESICTSDSIDGLSAFEETVFYRLIVNCDDYGRFDGRPKVLSSRLFPLKSISEEQMETSIQSLVDADLIILYTANGKPYIQVNTWSKHQNIRARKSKYPNPDDCTCIQMNSDVSDGIQVNSSESKSPRTRTRTRTRIRNREAEDDTRAREDTAAAAENPFGEVDDSRPDFNTVEVYAANQLGLTPGNMQEFAKYKAELSDDLIRHAIDEAGASRARTWKYVRSILNRYIADGIKTVEQAVAQEEAREDEKVKSKPQKPSYVQESEDFWSRIPRYD